MTERRADPGEAESAAPRIGRRIVVVGSTGSGKTTVAKRLAGILGAPYVELDALSWEPGWRQAPDGIFRDRVAESIRAERWVVDGNYRIIRDLLWPRAETIVWLDYSFKRTFWPLLTRTVRQAWRREELWRGCRVSWRRSFLSRESIIVWLFQSYRRRRREYPQRLAEHSHLRAVRLRRPAETERWLATVGERPD